MKTYLRVTMFALAVVVVAGTAHGGLFQHERLRVRNTFKTPEEVVSYYCSRDASGFVWSGLLDAERKAFTSWSDAPQVDSFYVAKSYQVRPSVKTARDPNHAAVEVAYSLLGVGDAHGTIAPPPSEKYSVTFDLARVGGVWKIVKPGYAEIAPVVLESKFPHFAGR